MAVLLTGLSRTTISANGNRMTNIVDPVNAQDAVTLAYLQANASDNAGILILEEGDTNIEVSEGTLVRIGGRYLIYTGDADTMISWTTGVTEDQVRASLPNTFEIFVTEGLYNFITATSAAELTAAGADYSTSALGFEVISEAEYSAMQTAGTLVPNRIYYVVDDTTAGGLIQPENGGTGLNPSTGQPGDLLTINGDSDGYRFIPNVVPPDYFTSDSAPAIGDTGQRLQVNTAGTGLEYVTPESGVEFQDAASALRDLTQITFNPGGDVMTLTDGTNSRTFSGGGGGAGIEAVNQAAAGVTMNVNELYYILPTINGQEFGLPGTPDPGDSVWIVNRSGTTGQPGNIHNRISAPAGIRIHGDTDDLILDNPEASFRIVFFSATIGWLIVAQA